jgi:hypothetical protein
MKKIIVILTPVVVVAATALLAILFAMPTNSAPARVMDIQTYISQNISTLSPVGASLGGTFFVTSIQAEDGHGVVEYEDGHNAYTADFIYTMNDREGIDITSFDLR